MILYYVDNWFLFWCCFCYSVTLQYESITQELESTKGNYRKDIAELEEKCSDMEKIKHQIQLDLQSSIEEVWIIVLYLCVGSLFV